MTADTCPEILCPLPGKHIKAEKIRHENYKDPMELHT